MVNFRPLNKLFVITALIASLVCLAIGQTAPNTQSNGTRKISSTVLNADQLLDDIRILSADDMRGRSADNSAMEKARDYVEKRIKASGVKPFADEFRQKFEITQRGKTETLKGVNFVGQIKGKKYPTKYIIVTAHYDHVGEREGEIFNGADDNASGTSALFALAAYFNKNKPEHSLIFVAFDAEEKGLQGARHFVANLPVPKESVLLNVNMDMLSRSDKGELYAAGAFHYPHLKPILELAQTKAKVKLLLGHDDPKMGRNDWTGQSDHGAFHREKIPFVYFGVEDHKDYHKSTDDFENIQPEFYVKAVETVIEAVKLLDKQLKK